MMTRNKRDLMADRDKFDSVNFYIESPSGTVNVIVAEDSPGKINQVFILIGKTGTEMRAMTDALARMITFAVRSNELSDVLAELSSITSDKVIRTTKGVDVRSVPEAIYIALMRYNAMYPHPSINNISHEYRAPKFTNYERAD
jgi:ribonucleoside-diphosphate reductase alpha chain